MGDEYGFGSQAKCLIQFGLDFKINDIDFKIENSIIKFETLIVKFNSTDYVKQKLLF